MKKRIGIIGTGLIGAGLTRLVRLQSDVCVSRVLTRRKISDMQSFILNEKLTNSVEDLIAHSDLIVECSGDVIYGGEMISKALEARLPVVTMNAELQVTIGSYLAERGYITEAEGDQPGCLAALNENIRQMGFHPVVYGNIKGFLNKNPKKEDMEYWSKRNGISLSMTTSFTDGTKVHIEQALVANGLGADILDSGLAGVEVDDSKIGGQILAELSSEGTVISDYILSPKSPPGVFITATHNEDQQEALRYYKLGEGPYYTLQSNFHLCHLEILKTIRRVLNGGSVLLNNGTNPRISVAAIAKRKLIPGDQISHGIGGIEVRGEAVRIADAENHIPIGLLRNAVIKRPIEEGEMLLFSDLDIPDTYASKAWNSILKSCLTV
ncbi:NAD(P)-dependent oxidoreductase [Bacillus sp. es.036]|uniref:NAD(P)-dependent oxidoreductase n=1 Tax=Bacillus sp. es.036 TaxID=1761764 RepID=UPI000BF4D244|nr:NAD(P)-dependent oxidoreductase [Bacillus sp. es.036]PFG15033.1 putative homoserine dehydrogenase-like protein [Bacillus sp. es.036]